ncbi:hypothetical protein PTNB73_10323 [Pyrenophora teres f. teres]|nr:hypothetical protein HRS9122_08361 [Pyrenophora teres f. teres]KAE8854893.1 hypothetical protein PTNB73_10323 [Pyrenophora teres f. teres]
MNLSQRYSLRPRPLQPPTRKRNLDTYLFQHLTADIEARKLDTDNSSYTPTTTSSSTTRSALSPTQPESSLSDPSSCELFGLEVATAPTHSPTPTRASTPSILKGKKRYYSTIDPNTPLYKHSDKAVWTILSRCGSNAKAILEGADKEEEAEYKNTTLDNCKGTISDFAERLRTAKAELEALDSDVTIAEPFFVDHFLGGLNENYASFLATFHQTHSLIAQRGTDDVIQKAAASFEEAVQAAERFEQGLKGLAAAKDFGLIAQGSQPTNQYKRKGPCSFCRHPGHDATDCYKKHPHLREQWKRSDAGKAWAARRAKTQPARDQHIGGLAHQLPLPEYEREGFSFMTTERRGNISANWALDTGCSRHISSTRTAFIPESLRPYSGPPMIGLGGESQGPTLIGTVELILCVDGQQKKLRLSDVLYSPTANCNLVSVSQLRRRGAAINFNRNSISVSTLTGLTAHCDEVHGLYLFRLWTQPAALAAYSLNQD